MYDLVQQGVVSHVVTQNVDGLHHLIAHGGVGDSSDDGYLKYTRSDPQRNPLTELHGNIHLVTCLGCGEVTARSHLQHRLRRANEELYKEYALDPQNARPDGDYHLPLEAVERMQVVGCAKCAGMLKPHVVLFGENVSRNLVEEVGERVKTAAALLCVGTSLQVFSAFRYALMAKEHGVPVVLVNAGKTRGDDLADLKVDTERLSVTLRDVVQQGFSLAAPPFPIF